MPYYSLCNMAIFATFENVVIFRILRVFSSRLLLRTISMYFLSPSCVILAVLNSVPKEAILLYYSPCNMVIFATFQNLVIFRILGVFSSRLLHRIISMCFLSPGSVILALLNSFPEWAFCLSIGHMEYGHFCHFSKSCLLSNIRRFFEQLAA